MAWFQQVPGRIYNFHELHSFQNGYHPEIWYIPVLWFNLRNNERRLQVNTDTQRQIQLRNGNRRQYAPQSQYNGLFVPANQQSFRQNNTRRSRPQHPIPAVNQSHVQSMSRDQYRPISEPIRSCRPSLESEIERQNENERSSKHHSYQAISGRSSECSATLRNNRANGLCLLIVNYKQDLSGYMQDIKAIEDFFTEIGYDVMGGAKDALGLRDLDPTKFREKLAEITQALNNRCTEYDCLVVFVISCNGTLSYLNDDDNAMAKDISVPEVVDIFRNVKSFETKPKFFVFQGCRSAEIPSHRSRWTFGGGFVPSLSNALIYQCTNLGHKSIMHPDNGSWLIHNMMQLFREHYKTTDVVNMLRILANNINEAFGANSSNSTAYNSPLSVNSLSGKLFLTSNKV